MPDLSLRKRHPFFTAFIWSVIGSIPFTLVSMLWEIKNVELDDFMKDVVIKLPPLKLFYLTVIQAPVLEEIVYRGPAWLILLGLLGLAALMRRFGSQNPFPLWKVRRFTLAEVCAWAAGIFLTYLWAMGHPYPLPIFWSGLVLLWLMIKTRNICWGILLHAFVNLLAFIGIVLRISFAY